MFDLRYHVASLAAVFFALVIGILVGVALASHGLGNAERKKLQADLSNAQSRINDLKGAAQADRAETQFATAAYDAVMANRLRGARVGVLFVGPVDNTTRTAIEDTLSDAGASMARMRAITVPVNAHAIEGALAKHSALASFAVGPKRFLNVGRELATEFVTGKDTSVWDALEGQLVEVTSGSGKPPVDAVVIVRTAAPQTRPASAQIVSGLLRALADGGVPAVGAEPVHAGRRRRVSRHVSVRRADLQALRPLECGRPRLAGRPGRARRAALRRPDHGSLRPAGRRRLDRPEDPGCDAADDDVGWMSR